MSAIVKVGSFQSGTGAINSTVSQSGFGFKPQCVIFWFNGRTNTTDGISRTTRLRGFGIAVDATGSGKTARYDSCAIQDESDDNANLSTFTCFGGALGIGAGAFCVDHINLGTGRFSLKSFDSGGFTLNTENVFNVSIVIHYMAIGGLTDLCLADCTEPGTTGNQDITNTGSVSNSGPTFSGSSFQPDGALVIVPASNAENGFGYSFGMVDNHGHIEMVSIEDMQLGDSVTHPQATTYGIHNQEIVAKIYGSQDQGHPHPLEAQATFVQFNSNGIRINWSKVDTGYTTEFFVLMFKGSNLQVGHLLTNTNTSNVQVSGLPIQPAGVMLFSACHAESAAHTTDINGNNSIGASDGTNQGVEASIFKDAPSDAFSTVVTSNDFDAAYVNTSSAASVQGEASVASLNSDGFTLTMNQADQQQSYVAYMAMGASPPTDKSHNIDADIEGFTRSDQSHNIDCYALVTVFDRSHNIDADIFDNPNQSHQVDCYIASPLNAISTVNLQGDIEFPINPANIVNLQATLATQDEQSVQLLATLTTSARDFINLQATLQATARSFVKLACTLHNEPTRSHGVDASIATSFLNFVQLNATLIQPLQRGPISGVYPDSSFVKLACWLLDPAFPTSTQVPGTNIEDFNSSQIACGGQIYSAVSRFVLNGVCLIVTGFSSGVISYQTRTRQWLQRIDAAPGGVLTYQTTQTRQLATGQVITVLTTVEQVQDTTITTVQTTDSGTPELTTISVLQKTASGNQVSREIQVINENGTKTTNEKKVVTTTPPVKDNVQPIKVTTLDGITHYQFFGAVNPEWAGGEEEGTTQTDRSETVVPGSLSNGSTMDAFGNPILVQTIDEMVTKPSGETILTHTETAGFVNGVGTTTTNTETQFNGIERKTITSVQSPGGNTTVTTKTESLISGDSVEVSTTTATDEFGQVTVTVQTTETVTSTDANGNKSTTVTTTTEVTQGGVVKTEVTTTIPDNFEDDIIAKKIKVYLILEFTITCVVDENALQQLLQMNVRHQTQFAAVELYGQQLGNANLSYAMRKSLERNFDLALDALTAIPFEALGKTYYVVFAPSASAFRAKYIVGAEPHVYELQMILQQRQDLILGASGSLLLGSPTDAEA